MFLFYPKVKNQNKKKKFKTNFNYLFLQNLKKEGNAVTYLYGYGGFDVSLMPSFSSMRCAFAEGFNGIVAVANLRGGYVFILFFLYFLYYSLTMN